MGGPDLVGNETGGQLAGLSRHSKRIGRSDGSPFLHLAHRVSPAYYPGGPPTAPKRTRAIKSPPADVLYEILTAEPLISSASPAHPEPDPPSSGRSEATERWPMFLWPAALAIQSRWRLVPAASHRSAKPACSVGGRREKHFSGERPDVRGSLVPIFVRRRLSPP